jgi:hypothetical protein
VSSFHRQPLVWSTKWDAHVRRCDSAIRTSLKFIISIQWCYKYVFECLVSAMTNPTLMRDDAPGVRVPPSVVRHEAVCAALKRHSVALCVANGKEMRSSVVTTVNYEYSASEAKGHQPANVRRWTCVIRRRSTTKNNARAGVCQTADGILS